MKLIMKNRSHRKTKIGLKLGKDTYTKVKISFLIRLCLYVLSNPQVYLRLISLKSEATLRLSRQSVLLINMGPERYYNPQTIWPNEEIC